MSAPGDADERPALRRRVKAALARWVLEQQRRRVAQAESSWPSAADEATHPSDGRRRFAEDYTFAIVQPGLGLVTRLEWLPGRGKHRVWVTLLREEGSVALPGGQQMLGGAPSDRWRAGGMVLDCLAPHERWTLRYTGRVVPLTRAQAPSGSEGSRRISLDLTFEAAAPPYRPGSDDDPHLLAWRLGQAAWDRSLLRSVRRVTSHGYVQAGDVTGSIALGDELIPVRASALRQHMWGVLDWGASDTAFQCLAALDDGDRAWVHQARFPIVTVEGGFVIPAGAEAEPVSAVESSAETRPGRAPAHVTVGLPSAAGRLQLELAILADASWVVDGRGHLDLGLARVSGAQGGWALWAGQRRHLPRP